MATSGNSRNLHKYNMAARTHLENNFPATYIKMIYNSIIWGFRYAESISNVKFSILGQRHVKIKMTVQRHL